jgi:hypothetical protein
MPRVRAVIVICFVIWMAAITWMLADMHGYLADLHEHDSHHWAAEKAKEQIEADRRLFERHMLEEETKHIHPYRSPEQQQKEEKLTEQQEEQAKKDAVFAAEGRHRPLTRLEELEALEQVKRDLAKGKIEPDQVGRPPVAPSGTSEPDQNEPPSSASDSSVALRVAIIAIAIGVAATVAWRFWHRADQEN